MSSFRHIPHPHIHRRKSAPPVKVSDHFSRSNAIERFNTAFALKITAAVGSMWCAYIFAAIALFGLPAAIGNGLGGVVQWIAQTFLQLVLLSIIIVGQNVQGAASDERAENTYQDAEAVLHEALHPGHRTRTADRNTRAAMKARPQLNAGRSCKQRRPMPLMRCSLNPQLGARWRSERAVAGCNRLTGPSEA